MQFFRTLSLTAKIVFLVLLLGAMAVVITLYSLSHLRSVDRAYRLLLERDAQAAVVVTAAMNDLNNASRLVFAVLTEQDEAAMRAVLDKLAAERVSFHAQMEIVRPLLPAAHARLDAIHQQEEQLFELAHAIVEAAARWRGDRALDIIHRQFSPLLAAMRKNMEQVRIETMAGFQQATQALGETTAHTLRNTALAFGVTLTVITGLAVWFSLSQIAHPIRVLTRSMGRLSQRDYAHAIEYTVRQDEVGQMAQALDVFRKALQHSDYLEIAKTEAEQLAQAKSSFLATMSHEIRTPLNAIIGLAQLGLRRSLAPDQKGRLENILRASQHLLGVINQILDFSKIEGGFLQVESVAFAPQQLLDDVRVLFSAKAAEKSLILLCELQCDVPVLMGDPQRIRQILFNFTSNAIKFSDRGTVTLRLALDSGAERWYLRGEVVDQGVGLDPVQIQRLFQPFHQADASTSRRYGGTGLGLAIARSLAELMGGNVGVQSQPGVGSTFWFRVAVNKAADGAQPVATVGTDCGASPDALQGLRALLVDDNELNRLVGSELLADAGIQVDLAIDGQQAIERLEQEPDGFYDVVLMDMMMPVLDGCAATAVLRQNPRFAQLPIIAMTANTTQQDIDVCLAAGMNALVPKPIDEQLLWSTLLAHCDLERERLPRGAVALPAPMPASPATVLEQFDLADTLTGFDVAAALRRFGGNVPLYARLAAMFIDQPPHVVQDVRQALAQQDLPTVGLRLHTLQGQAATLGAVQLQEAAAQIEAALKQSEPVADLEPLLERLQRCLTDATEQLQQRFGGMAQAPSSLDAAAADAAMAGSLPRVLVVDDQASNALVLQQMLGHLYAVSMASSGAQALQMCQDSPLPDLILLDVVMPGMDGLEVCRRLKADPRTTDIPVIFVTTQSTPEEESAALAVGGVDFISKPVNQTVVHARVHTHLKLKAQSDELRQFAWLDGLTGLANRRRFDDALALEWRDGLRHGRPLALLLVDVDHFKNYNDHYGHLAGDACLKAVARTLQQQMGRAHDLAARYGGEEFACLLPGMEEEGALAKAEALCRAVAGLDEPHAASPVASHVTISVGVAVWRFDRLGTLEQWMGLADAALYAAKQAGRNRAVLSQL